MNNLAVTHFLHFTHSFALIGSLALFKIVISSAIPLNYGVTSLLVLRIKIKANGINKIIRVSWNLRVI